MLTRPRRTTDCLMAFLMLFTALLSACGENPTSIPPTQQATQPVLATNIPTQQPSPTTDPARAILVSGQGAEDQAIQSGLSSLAGESGLTLEVKPLLQAEDITPGVKVVVTDVHVDEFAALAARYNAVQFVDLAHANQPAPNLTVIGSANQTEQQAFLAGYIAAITTPDYRVGILSLAGAPGQAARDAFFNGVGYLCGICNPKYPPYSGYPLASEAASSSDIQAAVDALKQKAVKTVYVQAELASPEAFDALNQAGMQLIGPGQIPGSPSNRWLATVGSDPLETLKTVWPDIASGKAGEAYPAALRVSDVNEKFLTEGKMRLVQQVMADIQSGLLKVENP